MAAVVIVTKIVPTIVSGRIAFLEYKDIEVQDEKIKNKKYQAEHDIDIIIKKPDEKLNEKLLKDLNDENNNDTLDLHLQRFLLMIMAKCLDININIYDSEKNHEFFIVNQEEKHNEINLFHDYLRLELIVSLKLHYFFFRNKEFWIF